MAAVVMATLVVVLIGARLWLRHGDRACQRNRQFSKQLAASLDLSQQCAAAECIVVLRVAGVPRTRPRDDVRTPTHRYRAKPVVADASWNRQRHRLGHPRRAGPVGEFRGRDGGQSGGSEGVGLKRARTRWRAAWSAPQSRSSWPRHSPCSAASRSWSPHSPPWWDRPGRAIRR